MARGDYERLTAQAADQVWLRLQAGHATKPTARERWLCTGTVRAHLLRCDGSRRPWRPASMVSLEVAANGGTKRYPGSARRPVCLGLRGPSLDVQSHGESADASAHNEAAPGGSFALGSLLAAETPD